MPSFTKDTSKDILKKQAEEDVARIKKTTFNMMAMAENINGMKDIGMSLKVRQTMLVKQ